MSDVLDRVTKIVGDHLDVEAGEMNENYSLINELGEASFDTVGLGMAFDDEFDIEIPDSAVNDIQPVGGVIKFINDAKS